MVTIRWKSPFSRNWYTSADRSGSPNPSGRPAPEASPPAATVARPAPPGSEDAPLPLIAYALLDQKWEFPLTAAPPGREWMEATPHRFAYRCLPMVIANQAGWLIHNPRKFVVTWTGGREPDALKVRYFGVSRSHHAASHFGCGVLTFAINYLFRTPPGYNLYVRGPANLPKDGVTALEGIVETDWSEATFTMNWVVTRRKHPIVFEKGEPIAMVSPIRRGELEQFRPEIYAIDDNAPLRAGYEAWMQSRVEFIAARRVPGSEAHRRRWQLHYMRGTTVTESAAPEHQTALALAPFVDKRK